MIKKRASLTPATLYINLLKSDEFTELFQAPHALRSRIDFQKHRNVVIDEVHHLIEEHKIRFLLTGSSVRKLKSQNANMLGGRARRAELFPLVYPE